MSCTTILIGKKASYDGSTIIARTEDSSSGEFTPKRFIVVRPEDQPRHYSSVLSKFEIDLPDNPMRYTSVPDALGKDGIWGEAGVNEKNVAMSETETITTNSRVLAADPLVADGIGEEDMLTLVLPYISSAREGVLRLGELLETYGTYESNGIAFSDTNEIWWLETIGGHHWMARRVPDDAYVVNPNQLGIDYLEFDNPKDFLHSSDLKAFVAENHLDLTLGNEGFNPRYAFGSQRDKDKHYNTPRAWFIQKVLNPEITQDPESFFIPWSRKPYRKITIEDVKYVLSGHYQDTPYDPYTKAETKASGYRPIGINRTSQTAILQLRPDQPHELTAIQWISYGSMPYATAVPFLTQINDTPEYFKNTTAKVTTDSFYWANRLLASLADPYRKELESLFDDYIESTMAKGFALIKQAESDYDANGSISSERTNQAISDMVQEETQALLDKVLFESSNRMTNRFSMSD